MKKNRNAKYYVPSIIQKLFVGIVGSLFIIQFLFLAQQGISQYQQNPNVGGLYSLYFTISLIPLLIFILAYALNPRPLNFVERCFESILIAVSGVIAWSIISMVYPTIFIENGPQHIESYARYEIIASSVMIIGYGFALMWLRSTKRWQ